MGMSNVNLACQDRWVNVQCLSCWTNFVQKTTIADLFWRPIPTPEFSRLSPLRLSVCNKERKNQKHQRWVPQQNFDNGKKGISFGKKCFRCDHMFSLALLGPCLVGGCWPRILDGRSIWGPVALLHAWPHQSRGCFFQNHWRKVIVDPADNFHQETWGIFSVKQCRKSHEYAKLLCVDPFFNRCEF